MIKLIKESGFNENGFAVTGYLYDNQRGAVADRYFDPDEWSEVEDYAHDLLMKGLFVNIVYFKTGDSININPDEYRNEFDGEFVINSEMAKFKRIATLGEKKTIRVKGSRLKETKLIEDGQLYKYVKSKEVYDSDGWRTEYTMYQDNYDDDHFVFVFGDSDLYDPNNGYEEFDWECDSRQEAEEWFDNYEGFDDDCTYDEIPF